MKVVWFFFNLILYLLQRSLVCEVRIRVSSAFLIFWFKICGWYLSNVWFKLEGQDSIIHVEWSCTFACPMFACTFYVISMGHCYQGPTSFHERMSFFLILTGRHIEASHNSWIFIVSNVDVCFVQQVRIVGSFLTKIDRNIKID